MIMNRSQLTKKFRNHSITHEEALLSGFRYVGGNGCVPFDCLPDEDVQRRSRDAKRHRNYFEIAYPKTLLPPPSSDRCLCGHPIRENCYITDDNIVLVLGCCCIKRFLTPENSGRTCGICRAPHKNRSNNFCKECRKEIDKFAKVRFPFGKYRGHKVGEVFVTDRQYVEWVRRQVKKTKDTEPVLASIEYLHSIDYR